jgi:cytoskeletal protein CcmA (bactofilin family)
VSNAGAVTITGKLNVSGDSSASSGYLDNTGGTQFTVGGDAYVAGSITNTTGKIYFEGNLKQGYGAFNNALGGIIIVDGDFAGSDILLQNAGILDFNGNFELPGLNTELINTTGSIKIGGKCVVNGEISNANDTIFINGNAQLTGPLSNTGSGSISIIGNCQVGTHVVNSGGGTITIYGKLDINGDSSAADGYLDNIGGGNITITGDTYISGNLINPTAVIIIEGTLQCNGTITNAGTLTYLGVYPETPVNISAVSTGGTDVLNLAAVAGYHYTINKLRLKCADPGANTVTVTLQELINGVLTAVDSFVIIGSLGINPNYQNYFSLMDMFGLPELFGDQLEVSVESSAGTYAVTGSYSYRSE